MSDNINQDAIIDALTELQQGDFDAALAAARSGVMPDSAGEMLAEIASSLRELAAVIDQGAQVVGIGQSLTVPSTASRLDELADAVRAMQARYDTTARILEHVTAEAGRAEQRLHERRRQLHLIIASMPNVLLLVDEQMQLSAFFIPPGFPPFLRGEFLAEGERIARVFPDEQGEEIESALWLARQHQQATTFETTWQLDGGETLYFEIKVSPVTDSDDLMILVNNITERRHEQLKIMQLKDDFIGSVSHELRTPIYAIKGFLDLLITGKVDDPEVQREFLQRASQSAERLTALVNDLLDITQLESDEFKLDITRFDLPVALAEAAQGLQSLADETMIRTHIDVASGTLDIYADRRRIQQVVVNLLGNAIKFSPPGSAVVMRCLQLSSGAIRVEVADEGAGIPPEEQPRLFTKFYQVDSEVKRAGKGTGLGLYLSRMIIEAHGGHIGLESIPGRGSTFFFELSSDSRQHVAPTPTRVASVS